ncbi:MAG TPA: indole-3-glycerol phosphate synthase TrpC [Candidatus Merdenecus merdavium]|nr:indole-3-glycerol phosphate synthase TrpC [Candidatus Merdenecus merdavium]
MILDRIVNQKKIRLIEHKQRINEEDMKELALRCRLDDHSFYKALKKPGLSMIGEFKNASPSKGIIHHQLGLEERMEQYNASVDAISCLTEEDYFDGSADHLKEIKKITHLPIIRKDFIIEEYQIYEAKAIGASAVLLIVGILDDETLKNLYHLAYALGMDVLVEVHDEEEMERALKINARIIGVNNRNLKDFTIDLNTTKRLHHMVPEDVLYISESGIQSEDDVVFLKSCGVDGVLIGTAFMESDQPKTLAQEWKMAYEK